MEISCKCQKAIQQVWLYTRLLKLAAQVNPNSCWLFPSHRYFFLKLTNSQKIMHFKWKLNRSRIGLNYWHFIRWPAKLQLWSTLWNSKKPSIEYWNLLLFQLIRLLYLCWASMKMCQVKPSLVQILSSYLMSSL